MKRLTILFGCLIFASIVFAQEHLTFKNIPIDGDIKNFTKEMISAGFSKDTENSSDTYTIFKGEFMGKSSEIYVFCTPTGLVFKVLVLHEYSTWSSLSSAFNDATELFTKKYGKPSSDYHFFSSPYYNGDGYELQALRNDKCYYLYIWEPDNGTIAVQLKNIGKSYYVTITYEDEINQKIRDNAKEKAALDDI